MLLYQSLCLELLIQQANLRETERDAFYRPTAWHALHSRILVSVRLIELHGQ